MIKTYDAIIVLGRGISPEGEIPESAKATVQKAVQLHKDGVANYIIFSGKWSRSSSYIPPTTEAKAMSDYSKDLGLPEKSIILEEESLDTISNCYYIKTRILLAKKWISLLLITLHPVDKRAGRGISA
jgi:uncharacterized SAM-binding protein YcdF (DUF218 family)